VTYRIDYLASVVRSDIPALPKAARARIKRDIEIKLFTRPVELGKPLHYSLEGCRRIRVGDYRVVYVVYGDLVTVVEIGHRKDIYEK
jgi:mRNA interferase RelE/StbE